MSRILIGIFVVGALAVIIGTVALPLTLSGGNTNQEDYKKEMAAWHVRWSASKNAEERRALIPEIEEIRSPIGSGALQMLDRHRIYVQAHVIFSQADELSTLALLDVAKIVPTNGSGQIPTCDTLESVLELLPGSGNGIAEVAWARDACSLLASSRTNLVIVRNQALLEWLRNEIRELNT